MKCPACGSEERDGALYCGMCKAVFGKPAPPTPVAPQLADDQWIRRDGAKGQLLDDVTYTRIRALCGPARQDAEAGRIDEANAQYEQALALLKQPLAWDAGAAIHAAVGENHLRAGRHDLARKHLSSAVQAFNGNQTPMFRWLLGEAMVELGDIEPALAHLSDARQMLGRDRLAHRHAKYHSVADRTPSFTLLADPVRPNEPDIHAAWRERPMAASGTTDPTQPAKVLFVVYANYTHAWPVIRSRYRVPRSLAIHVFGRNHELFAQWYAPPVGELLMRNQAARAVVSRAQTAVIISGDLADGADLVEYWRTVQLVTAALPVTGAAIYDPAALRWFAREQWLAAFPDGGGLEVRHHVRVSRKGADVLTGGLRKFGRPDVVMRNVAPSDDGFASEALVAIAESMVLGARVSNGPITLGGRQFRGWAHLGEADRDNPYVENTWIEILPLP